MSTNTTTTKGKTMTYDIRTSTFTYRGHTIVETETYLNSASSTPLSHRATTKVNYNGMVIDATAANTNHLLRQIDYVLDDDTEYRG